jgi:pyrimidine operon attenuation protein/uracil phosphoribosyltransferase
VGDARTVRPALDALTAAGPLAGEKVLLVDADGRATTP